MEFVSKTVNKEVSKSYSNETVGCAWRKQDDHKQGCIPRSQIKPENPRSTQAGTGGGRQKVQREHSTCQMEIGGREELARLQEGGSWAESEQRAPVKVGRRRLAGARGVWEAMEGPGQGRERTQRASRV